MEDMKVLMHYPDEDDWGDEQSEESNWWLATQHSTFSHRDACEFIFYVGDAFHLTRYSDLGFNEAFLSPMRQAREMQYKYICFYGG